MGFFSTHLREKLDLILITCIAILFASINISIHFFERIYFFIYHNFSLELARYISNFVFLYLAGLLLITFRRWRIAEKKKKELENIIQSISPDVLIVVDRQRNIVKCNKMIEQMFGYTADEVLHKKVDMLYLDNEAYSEHLEAIYRIIGEKGFHIETATGKKKSGDTLYVEIITGSLGRYGGAVMLFRDITERKKYEEKLQALSITDDLTGLYNRRGFMALMEQQIKLSERTKRGILLIYVDVDNLKFINDTFGHTEGDNALRDIATILSDSLRKAEIIARIGGDEFAIAAIETPEENTDILIDRIYNNFAIHNSNTEKKYSLSVTTGTAYFNPESPLPIEELLDIADRNMYARKKELS